MHPVASLVYFQLKYCERCGGLWLRPAGTATAYCPNCEPLMAALPRRACQPGRKIVPATRAPAALAPLSTAADFAPPVSAGVV